LVYRRSRQTISKRDWSPDVCSSDLMKELTGLSFAGEVQIPADRVDDHTVHQAPGSPALLSVGEVPGGQGPAGDAEPFAPRDAACDRKGVVQGEGAGGG